jgi:hypothetical protein
MSSEQPPVLQLWALDQPLEPVQFVQDGPSYPMLSIDGMGEQIAYAMADQTAMEKRDSMVQLVRRIVPEAPSELIDALTFEKLDLLIALASRQVRTVEEYMGKFRAEAGAASTSATPSGIPSPA